MCVCVCLFVKFGVDRHFKYIYNRDYGQDSSVRGWLKVQQAGIETWRGHSKRFWGTSYLV